MAWGVVFLNSFMYLLTLY